MTAEELKATIEGWLVQLRTSSAPGEEVYPEPEEVIDYDVLEGVDRDTYHDAMEMLFDEYGVPEDQRAEIYDQLDAGEYDPNGYAQNIVIVLDNDTVNNHVDNSIQVEEGAHVDDITQHNVTNVATASGEGAIAGRDQEGQFQTGDGVQVGDDNAGVVNQGDNSGQQAGYEATADDFTTGDGNFNNEGTIDDSAVAFGGGSADNQADQIDDQSVNYSGNTEDSFNTDGSFNTDDSYNYDEEYTETTTVDAELNAHLENSANQDNDYKDVDDSHNVDYDDYEPAEEAYE